MDKDKQDDITQEWWDSQPPEIQRLLRKNEREETITRIIVAVSFTVLLICFIIVKGLCQHLSTANRQLQTEISQMSTTETTQELPAIPFSPI